VHPPGTALDDAIDGAYDRTMEGLAQAEADEVIPLEDPSARLGE
jgi:hypothetical protein